MIKNFTIKDNKRISESELDLISYSVGLLTCGLEDRFNTEARK